MNAHFPPKRASERVEKDLIRDRNDSIGNAFETDSFHTVNTEDDVDRSGLSINQMEDGRDDHNNPSRFWFANRN